MVSERFTITLPKDLGIKVRKRAREEKKPVSRIIADDVQTAERERISQLMIEGYIATREESRRIAEEWFEVGAETWPDDDWSDLIDDQAR